VGRAEEKAWKRVVYAVLSRMRNGLGEQINQLLPKRLRSAFDAIYTFGINPFTKRGFFS
jgi:hypothetical protein